MIQREALPTENPSHPAPTRTLAADSLATGVVFMLGLNVVQRLIGFARNLLFCGLLEDDQLGRWSLALGFLVLAAPLAVLGLPGSFGRYVEHYRSRGQLRYFLVRTTSMAACGCLAMCVAMWLAAPWFAWLIFRDPLETTMVGLLAVTLLFVVGWNYFIELYVALRQVRIVTLLHVVSSVVFAVVGAALLVGTTLGERGVVIAYAAGVAVPLLAALVLLRYTAAWQAPGADPPPHRVMWGRVFPFAAWLWLMNVLCNLFESADRFMIVHFAPVAKQAADAMVGQYHASRVIPVLLVAVAVALASMLLPYLTHDWEAGRRDRVAARTNLTLKIVAILFTFAGLIILLTSPWLFGWALRGKYNAGLTVLPWTVAYCVWYSLITLSFIYLQCAEKMRWGVAAVAAGVGANIVLNALLLPVFGLHGAVWATTAGNAIALAAVYVFNHRLGQAVGWRVWVASALPATLGFGAWPAAIVFTGFLLLELWRPVLLSPDERRQLDEVLMRYVQRWRPIGRRFPVPS